MQHATYVIPKTLNETTIYKDVAKEKINDTYDSSIRPVTS